MEQIKEVSNFIKTIKETTFKPEEQVKIISALNFATQKHNQQLRDSGEPYIIHPIAVAEILLDYGLDCDTICSALLHDVIEDTDTSLKELELAFGEQVARLVNGVSKVTSLSFVSSANENNESLRKMFLAMAKDIRVIFVKLADRLNNMRTLDSLSEDRIIRKALETKDVYIPIAERLGLSSIKGELEDICFKYLYPKEYNEVSNLLEGIFKKHKTKLDAINGELKAMLTELNIKGDVKSRFKRKYSVYKKKQSKGIEQIYDILAHRVLVDDIKDCYFILGEVHNRWKPVPGRIKDYIAAPKPNGYQSLHTTLLTEDGMPFEVQIRTYEMHKVCEYGVAAHWKYKNKSTKKNTELDDRLTFLRQIIEESEETLDTTTFINNAKSDFYSSEIFVFTPKYKVIQLPEKSTPIDFAYALHSDIGNRLVGAKVNSKMVPITSKLETGDIVEIITADNSKGPSRDWLKLAQTPSARSKIRAYFKKETKEENIKIGKEMLEIESKRRGVPLSTLLNNDAIVKKVLEIHNLFTIEDMCASVGYGGLTATHIINQLYNELRAVEKQQNKELLGLSKRTANSDSGVVVKGAEDLPTRLARCCNPLPNDDIIGFVSVGKGICVHKADCPNIRHYSTSNRLVRVAWRDITNKSYSSVIFIKANDIPNLLTTITQVVNSVAGVSLTGVVAKAVNKVAMISLTVLVQEQTQITNIINKLSALEDVIVAHRK